MKKHKLKYNEDDILSREELIALLAVYESEFEHRDKVLYSRIYHFFYISIIIMLCPFVSIGGVSIELANIPSKCFIIAGMICEGFACFISIVHANRLSKSSKTYKNIIQMLPPQYRRISTLDSDSKPKKDSQSNDKRVKKGKDKITIRNIMNTSMAYFVPIIFTVISFLIGIILPITST
ncbi:MAG: hypothetical protein HFE75_02490 [Firmicutes bacterium]|jgi:hypothetical protein|nr:hypothetical protein [Bacillota bacterium]